MSDGGMTSEEIMALPVGPELDAIVADKVMGWGKWEWCEQGHSIYPGPGWNWTVAGVNGVHVSRWLPSACINDAWLVLEKLFQQGGRMTMLGGEPHPEGKSFRVGITVGGGRTLGNGWACLYAETAPLAICRAALLAVARKGETTCE